MPTCRPPNLHLFLNDLVRFVIVVMLASGIACAPGVGAAEAVRTHHSGRVLIVASSSGELVLKDGRHVPTGYYLNELAIPAMRLEEAGYDLVVATPSGEKPPMDPRSNDKVHFGDDQAALAKALAFVDQGPAMQVIHPLKQVVADGLDGFAGIYIPGGHAPMNDLMQDVDLGTALRHFHEAKQPTVFLCHGPVAALSALPDPVAYRNALVRDDAPGAGMAANGWPYAGYRMAIFSDDEERVVTDTYLKSAPLFSVAEALRLAGAKVETGKTFAPLVVIDREMITGQNPASDHAIGEAMVTALEHARLEKIRPSAEQPLDKK